MVNSHFEHGQAKLSNQRPGFFVVNTIATPASENSRSETRVACKSVIIQKLDLVELQLLGYGL